ncbi:MAG: DUF2828 domain-containing protein [Fischerella sp.]|nr:DUF2828 domain-containing protein [Fischerella sp.]
MDFKQAVENTATYGKTANGADTLDTSMSKLVDLFFMIGASRGKDITAQFEAAYQENASLARKILFWARDVRGGAGERQTFRNLLKFIEKNHPGDVVNLIPHVPEFGRWDDLLVFESQAARDLAFFQIKEALLTKQNGLCAKWMPRQGADAVALRNYLGLTPKGYRKLLVGLTKVVEQQMCANKWTEIDYSHVPSLAAARYQKAFSRHDAAGYKAYKESLVRGEAKINAAAVYPYDVVKSLAQGDAVVAREQWKALPNYVGDQLILPMVDVSGSMSCPVGGNKNLKCIDVAVSLGLYLADKNTGPFKDMFLTFSSRPKIQVLKGDILSKYNQLTTSEWGVSTNLSAAFEEVLRVGQENKVPEADMPKYILILSDMEFDDATGERVDIYDYDHKPVKVTAMADIEAQYMAAGYTVPKVIFWNLNARAGNVPVKYNKDGTALVSGFSPAIMKSILAAEKIAPFDIMMATISSERYAVIQ